MHHSCHLLSRCSCSFFLLLFNCFSTKNHPVSLGCLQPWCARVRLDPSKKTFQTQRFFNVFAFYTHQPRTYMHHSCHLLSRGSFPFFLIVFACFSTKDHPVSLCCLQPWGAQARLGPSKKPFKDKCFFSIFAFLAPPNQNIYASFLPSPVARLRFLLFASF